MRLEGILPLRLHFLGDISLICFFEILNDLHNLLPYLNGV